VFIIESTFTVTVTHWEEEEKKRRREKEREKDTWILDTTRRIASRACTELR
jgi:hypothetical protein